MTITHGKEPGRGWRRKFYRTERDSTGVNAAGRKHIDPKMEIYLPLKGVFAT